MKFVVICSVLEHTQHITIENCTNIVLIGVRKCILSNFSLDIIENPWFFIHTTNESLFSVEWTWMGV